MLLGWVLSRCFLAPLGVMLVMKTLEGEQHVVIKAYKFTVFEICAILECNCLQRQSSSKIFGITLYPDLPYS